MLLYRKKKSVARGLVPGRLRSPPVSRDQISTMTSNTLGTIERIHTHSSSLARRFDPRGKIVAAVLFSVAAALVQDLTAAGFALAAAITLAVFLRIPFRLLSRRLWQANLFVLFLWVILPFSISGKVLAAYGPLAITLEGIRLAGLITLKSNAIILVFLSLVVTSPIFVIGHALGSLGIPDKLVHLLLFTYRYLHVMEQEYRRLRDAVTVRAFRPRTSLHSYKTYSYFLGMLLVRSFSRAERVRQAMLCRGFVGRFYSLQSFRYTIADGLLVLTFALISIGMVSIQWL